MTKKDYELIAKTLREEYLCLMQKPRDEEAHGVLIAAVALSRAFLDNPHFDPAKFLIACGHDPESKVVMEANR
jgi:hypothetical protein